MLQAILSKLLIVFSTLIGVSLISFLMIRLIPGDPAEIMLGSRGGSKEALIEIKKHLGLDQSLFKQYVIFLKNTLQGDLGHSIVTRKSVWEEFKSHFPSTVELSGLSLFWALIFGIPIGIVAAIKRNSFLDRSLMGFSLTGYSMPIFWWGLVLILIFSVQLNLTPVSGRLSAFYDVEAVTGFMFIDVFFLENPWPPFWNVLWHLLLPSITLSSIPLAVISRMTRSSFLEVLDKDYIRTAKAKGLSRFSILTKHALKNAMIPIVTVVGFMGGRLLTGSILTESIFSWPGIGRWILMSVEARDYPVVQGGVLILAVLILFMNLFLDLVYFWINPQLREELKILKT